ncbi:NADP-dependent oxidoreductase [Nocardia arthritidis]|uniref:Zinc-binding dehydrogenase n=1 Tax=Nocardia arthritidis TaxID=228602 RepID=A0A6G9YGS8_9NOCA|nr:NADP-dependent oxidoreductase [Nocardia arthritidis]QIS12173.1 zinc-binding dehydrogenase [Nocardia arthritidis]
MTKTYESREIRLAERPQGMPGPATFELAKTEVPEPGPRQVLVRNTWMSVDPYMRGRMDDGDSYIAPFAIGAPLDGHAIGEVVASRADIPVGATVAHFAGWREYALLDAETVTALDISLDRPQDHLGVLGQTGFTAYLAVTEFARVRAGDVVFVSGAAGAVGSVAGQLARKFGAATVIGSAGGPDKARALTDTFGFDIGLDYRAGAIGDQLRAAAPGGIDVYIDNVGGDHLEAALDALTMRGRAALVGMISGYNTPVPGPRNLYNVVTKHLSLQGVLVTEYLDRQPAYTARAARWVADGSLRGAETIVDGIENAPDAFLGMLRGANIGKMLVRL